MSGVVGAGTPDGPRPTPRRLDAALDRAGLVTARSRDVALAAVVALLDAFLVAVVAALAATADDIDLSGPRATALVVVTVVQAAVLVARRWRPLETFAAVVGLQVVLTALTPADVSVRGVAAAVVGFTVGSRLGPRTATVAVVTAALVEGVSAAVLRADVVDGLAQLITAALLYGASAAVGTYVATQRRYLALLREQAEGRAETERANVRAAIAAERGRMARELHDVAAHHLSGMVVQASAVQRLVDRDPAAAREGAGWLRDQGRRTLDDLRRVVGVLRESGPDLAGEHLAPVPGLADLDDLVETARRLGTRVEVERRGDARDLPPIADVTLYRVAQEALANVRRHASDAPVRLLLEHRPHDVLLVVENAASDRPSQAEPGAPRGVGLVGMAERAQLVGADLETGPAADGGWRVALRLPVDADDRVEEER